MKFLRGLWVVSCLLVSPHTMADDAYLKRFLTYQAWSQHLLTTPTPEFLTFIQDNRPLSQRLREKWLYQLAQQKDWNTYALYYQPSKDPSLRCFAATAHRNQGDEKTAKLEAQSLWLTGQEQPPACRSLFHWLLEQHPHADDLIHQRVAHALEERNITLARALLMQSPSLTHHAQANWLMKVHQRPSAIHQLPPSPLASTLYLYGLKRLLIQNMDNALSVWQQAKTKRVLSPAQQQAFLAHVALYKAMRDKPDAPHWFAQVKPAFYNDVLLGWQIRFALKHQHWKRVEALIKQSPEKESPCWQYWLARSLEAQGRGSEANTYYQTLAKTRHYYGFLASVRLHQSLHFDHEKTPQQESLLTPYQPLIQQIQTLYTTKQLAQASRLLNEFTSELPKEEISAVSDWVANQLQWYAKSIYLSNHQTLANQLSLRFPLAYPHTIEEQAKHYQISPALIYAIIRQESAFGETTISPAGAYGLMQLMPQTAALIARHEHVHHANPKQLFSYPHNIHLGVAYLRDLAVRFKHPLLMVAAYNAGPRQANLWLKNHTVASMDLWIETLPWPETRNYLKNVIAFYAVYQYLMHGKSDVSAFMKPF